MIYFIGEEVDFEGVKNSTIEYLLEYFKDVEEKYNKLLQRTA